MNRTDSESRTNRTAGLPTRPLIGMKRIRRHPLTRWSTLFAAACAVGVTVVPVQASAPPAIPDTRRPIPARASHFPPGAYPRPAPDVRKLTPAEMHSARGRGYRNRNLSGVLPWQRQLRDVNL